MFNKLLVLRTGLPGDASGKRTHLPMQETYIRDTGFIPGLGRSHEGGHGNPLQYSCLENPMDRGGIGEDRLAGYSP